MTKVWVYEIEKERLDELEEKTGASTAEIIETLLDLLEKDYTIEEFKNYLP